MASRRWWPRALVALAAIFAMSFVVVAIVTSREGSEKDGEVEESPFIEAFVPAHTSDWLFHLRRGMTVNMSRMALDTACLPPSNERRRAIQIDDANRRRLLMQHKTCEALTGLDTANLHPWRGKEYHEERWMRLYRRMVMGPMAPRGKYSRVERQRQFNVLALALSDAVDWTTAQPRDDTTEAAIAAGRLEGEGSQLRLRTDTIATCDFNYTPPYPLAYDEGAFAQQAYDLAEWTLVDLFAREGFLPIAYSGTLLGAVRHAGVYLNDDDVDFHIFPPAMYALGAVAGWEFHHIYTHVDDSIERYGKERMEKIAAASDGGGEKTTPFLFFRPDVIDTSYPYFRPRPWLIPRRNIPERVALRDFVKKMANRARPCTVMYASANDTERRETFHHAGVCRTSSWYVCVQAPQYALSSPASLFSKHRRFEMGKVCRCPFGKGGWVLCPKNSPAIVKLWYGKNWCVPIGVVRGSAARKAKAWDD